MSFDPNQKVDDSNVKDVLNEMVKSGLAELVQEDLTAYPRYRLTEEGVAAMTSVASKFSAWQEKQR